jgi:hypothetical protein
MRLLPLLILFACHRPEADTDDTDDTDTNDDDTDTCPTAGTVA